MGWEGWWEWMDREEWGRVIECRWLVERRCVGNWEEGILEAPGKVPNQESITYIPFSYNTTVGVKWVSHCPVLHGLVPSSSHASSATFPSPSIYQDR